MAIIQPPPIGTPIIVNEAMAVAWVQWFTQLHKETNDNRSRVRSQTLASTSSVAFVKGIDKNSDVYEIDLNDVAVSALNSRLILEASIDKGVTYLGGSGDYQWSLTSNTDSTTAALDIRIPVTLATLGNTANYKVNGIIKIYSPSSASHTYIRWDLILKDSSDVLQSVRGSGVVKTQQPINALRIRPDAGNLKSGKIKLYSIQ